MIENAMTFAGVFKVISIFSVNNLLVDTQVANIIVSVEKGLVLLNGLNVS